MEFGMTRKSKGWGLRRIRSTRTSSGKGSSYIRFHSDVPITQLCDPFSRFKLNTVRNSKCTHLMLLLTDPEYLKAVWYLDERSIPDFKYIPASITHEKFVNISKSIEEGKFRFSSQGLHQRNNPRRVIDDQIVFKALGFLLQQAIGAHCHSYNLPDTYGWYKKGDCHEALRQVRLRGKDVPWFIKGTLGSNDPTYIMNRKALESTLKRYIDDTVFLSFIFQGLKGIRKEQTLSDVEHFFSQTLAQVYWSPVDEWFHTIIIPSLHEGAHRTRNPAYTKMLRVNKRVTDHSIRPTLTQGYKRCYYTRYHNVFLLGVIASKRDCSIFVEKFKQMIISTYGKAALLHANAEIFDGYKTKTPFLRYFIHTTRLRRMKIAYDSKRRLTRRVPRTMLTAPLSHIIQELANQGCGTPTGTPVRNTRLVHLQEDQIVLYFKSLEKRTLEYYALGANSTRVAARVHYICKYSCALTIASKMKLRTLRKVFKKYGKDLRIKNPLNDTFVSYPSSFRKSTRKEFESKVKRSGRRFHNMEHNT